MDKKVTTNKENKTKGFFSRLIEKIDRKMEEKAKVAKNCCSSKKNRDNSCCS